MRLMLYNRLGMIMLSIAVFLAVLVGPGAAQENGTLLALTVGGLLLCFDIGVRLRLYRAPHDKLLFFLSETHGGQILCLPLWLWGGIVVAATLTQRNLPVAFGIAAGLADVIYRLRQAQVDARPRLWALVTRRGALPPLWLFAGCLLILTYWRTLGLENAEPASEFRFRMLFFALHGLFNLVRAYFIRRGQPVEAPLDADPEKMNRSMSTAGESLLRLAFLFLGMLMLLYAVGPEHMRQYALPLPPALRWLGFACSVGVLPLLIWVHRSLGEHGSRGLQTQPHQIFVTHGPYRWVRHPMYTVLGAFYLGTALLSANGLILGVSLGITGALCARIPTEERLLVAHFGTAYETYRQQTGRLWPRLRS